MVRVLYNSKGYFSSTSVLNDDDNNDDAGKKATVTTHRLPKWRWKWYQHKPTSLGWLLSEPQGPSHGIGEANNKKRQQQQHEKMMLTSRATCRLYTTIDITAVVLITIGYLIIICAIILISLMLLSLWLLCCRCRWLSMVALYWQSQFTRSGQNLWSRRNPRFDRGQNTLLAWGHFALDKAGKKSKPKSKRLSRVSRNWFWFCFWLPIRAGLMHLTLTCSW
jgi:hypothetical protein